MSKRFRADRVRTLRAFFKKVGQKRPRMARMDSFFTRGKNLCTSVGCVAGWTQNFFDGQYHKWPGDLLGLRTERLSNGHGIFEARHEPQKPNWEEAYDRLTVLLKDHGAPLKGPMAPRPRIKGLDF